MPKVVDHEAYRLELTQKAAEVFTEHGYHGLGMRGIAEALGISKSALYHYFPSKEALFAACTSFITQPQMILGEGEQEESASLTSLLKTMDQNWQGELNLLLDYIRGKSPSAIKKDKLLRLANEQYLNAMQEVSQRKDPKQVYAMVLGGLMIRLFDGHSTKLDDIEDWVQSLPES